MSNLPAGRSAMLALLATALLATTATAEPAAEARIRRDVKTLSSDAFEGRLPGTAGEEKAVRYIIKRFRAAGLQPGGELVKGRRSWFQTVPMTKADVAGAVTVSLTVDGVVRSWTRDTEYSVYPNLVTPGVAAIANAPLVFIGYGVNAPEHRWDDYKGADLTGKVAVVLGNDPDIETADMGFGGKATSPYGGRKHKMSELRQRGAVGILTIHDPVVTGFGWKTVTNSAALTRYFVQRPDTSPIGMALEGDLAWPAALDLFKAAGLDFAALKKRAQTRDFAPVVLPGVTISSRYETTIGQGSSKTVIGILPGTRRPEETIVYGAHWDHEGIGTPDAKGDRIYNGAFDNATGVATVIEVARLLGQRPRTERSILFMAFTLEEPGLLGSSYYAAYPLYSLPKTAAVIVFDGMNPVGRARDFGNHAYTRTELNDLLIEAGARQGRRFTPEPYPGLALEIRTDHFPFTRKGVPPIFFMPGEDLLVGGTAVGQAFLPNYFKTHYHQPSDEYQPDWKFDGTAQDAELVADLGHRLANSASWPAWKEGGEYKAVRDESAAERR